jgi:hypothetical protein
MSRAEEAAGGVAYWRRMGKAEAVARHYERSLEFARASGDPAREAWAIYNMSFAYDYVPLTVREAHPDAERAMAMRRDALNRFTAMGDERGAAYAMWGIAGSPLSIGVEVERNRALLADALRGFRDVDDAYGETWALMSLAMIETAAGQRDAARRALDAAAALFVRDGDFSGQVVVLDAVAAMAAEAGDVRLSVRLDAAARSMRRATGILTPPIPGMRGPIADAREALPADEIETEEALGTTMALDELLASTLIDETGGISKLGRSLVDFARLSREPRAATDDPAAGEWRPH